MIVTGPAEADEFDHHPRFKELIDRGAIVLVDARIGRARLTPTGSYRRLNRRPCRPPFDFDGWWQDVAQAVRAQLEDVTA